MLSFVLMVCTLQAPATPTREVKGSVVDEKGQPVAGARLVVVDGYRPSLEPSVAMSEAYPPPRKMSELVTDPGGKFSLQVPLPWNSTAFAQPMVLTVWRGDRLEHALALDLAELVPDQPLRLACSGPAAAELRVEDAAGQPIASAKVQAFVFRCGEGSLVLPPELCTTFGATTGADGRATLANAPSSLFCGVLIESPAHGTQLVLARRDGTGLDVVTLRSCGAVRGRVLAPAGPVSEGTCVSIKTYAPLKQPGNVVDSEERRLQGQARVSCAADGTFSVPALARGIVRCAVEVPAPSTLRARIPTNGYQTLEAEELTVELALVPGVPLSGVVRDGIDGPPLAGVPIRVETGFTFHSLVTDARGVFRVIVPSGHGTAGVFQVPRPFLPPPQAGPFGARFDMKDGTPLELPPIELVRGVQVRGRVLDAAGKPCAGARVRATWKEQAAFGQQTRRRLGFADGEGRFSIEGVTPGMAVDLEAMTRGAQSDEPVQVESGSKDEAVLRLVRAKELRSELSGLATDTQGQPLEGARVLLAVQYLPGPNHAASLEDLTLEARSGPDGRFALDARLEEGRDYAVRVEKPGFLPRCSAWQRLARRGPLAFGKIALRRWVPVTGFVRDERGNPIAGARVLAAGVDGGDRPVPTDQEGRFELSGVREGTVHLLAVLADGRYAAARVQVPAAAPVEIRVRAEDVALRSLPHPVPEPQARALALRVYEPCVREALAGNASDKMSALENLALMDLPRALELIDRTAFPAPWQADFARLTVSRLLAASDPESGLMVVEALVEPERRCQGYLHVMERLPAEAGVRRRALVSEALLQARAIRSPQMRVAMLANVAEALADLGDELAGRAVLAECSPIVRQLPAKEWAGYARCLYAEQLALVDLPAALAIIAGLTDQFSLDRHHGNIAHELAGRDPAAAEEVFKKLTDRGRFVPRVCWRMAPLDAARARRIAEDPAVPALARAHGLGVMAQALAEKEKEPARLLLEEAFRILATEREAPLAGVLLPAAERIDPLLVRGFVARALALRRAYGARATRDHVQELDRDARLALMLQRYDPEAARSVLEPIWDEASFILGVQGSGSDAAAVVAALVVDDPERAIAAIEALNDDWDTKAHRAQKTSRRLAAQVLMNRGERRWDWIQERLLRLWTIDKEDL